MRIAYLLNTLAIGGAERLIVTLAESMIDRGHRVEIVAVREPFADELESPAWVHHLGARRNPATFPRSLLRAIRVLRTFQPDIIHSNNFHGNVLSRALRPFVPHARIISTLHNVYEGGWMRRLVLRLTDPLSDHTAAVCRAAAEEAVRRGVVPRSKCSVVTSGIDCCEFTPEPDRWALEPARTGQRSDFVWLAVGRLAPAKDYPNLLRAFAKVQGARLKAWLWIAGEGKKAYSRRLRQLADELGVGASIRWLGPRLDIPDLLDMADGFVLSSAWEGMPLALAEAMAMEKPFVATDVGGVRELAGECGGIVPAQDPKALAASMLEVMRGPRRSRQSRGHAARQRILEHFTIQQSAAQWEALYQRVLENARGRARNRSKNSSWKGESA